MYSLVNKNIDDGAIQQINKEYQIYFLFVVFIVSLQLICNTIEPIIFSYGSFRAPASSIFYVLSFTVSDIITENFGFKLAVRATVLNVIAQFIYCGIAAIVYIAPKQYLDSHAVNSFQYMFQFLSFELLGSIFSLVIAMITNDYLINKLKLIFLGRGFWWRTIVSTVLGEIIMLNIDYNITFMSSKSLSEIQHLIFSAMSYKVTAAFLLALPAAALSRYVGRNIFYLRQSMNQKTYLIKELKHALLFR
jgi:uncharacterized PurR-regulated membrane protein YhhQ (DUF165 family)